MLTNALIPTNGIWITKNFAPAGFNVARYDAKGFTSDGRWFQTLAKAEAYAAHLRGKPDLYSDRGVEREIKSALGVA